MDRAIAVCYSSAAAHARHTHGAKAVAQIQQTRNIRHVYSSVAVFERHVALIIADVHVREGILQPLCSTPVSERERAMRGSDIGARLQSCRLNRAEGILYFD